MEGPAGPREPGHYGEVNYLLSIDSRFSRASCISPLLKSSRPRSALASLLSLLLYFRFRELIKSPF